MRGLKEFEYNLTHLISCNNTGANNLVYNIRIGNRSKHI